MESSDTTSNRKIPLEELSKDELIKKCNNFLIIAKKAKQAKDESSEELKKYKENEMKLSSDVAALKEVVESFNKKQHEFAEVQNKHKISEEKNTELQKDFHKLQEKYAAKITECSKLSETLKKLSDKISKLEISNSEYADKLNDFKENYAKIDIENKMKSEKLKELQQKENECRKKLQLTEEKYIKLEFTLKEFQGKYLRECKNHEELQETLAKLQNKSSSGRCSSRSSDSLKPVYENQEYDEILEKYNELLEKNKLNITEIEKLSKKNLENEELVKELSSKYQNLIKTYENVPENWRDVVIENRKLQENLNDSEKLREILREKEVKYEQLLAELDSKKRLILENGALVNENQMLKNKLNNLEISHKELTGKLNETLASYDKALKSLDQSQTVLESVKSELEKEIEKHSSCSCVQVDTIKAILNEKNNLLNDKIMENEKLQDSVKMFEQMSSDLKSELSEVNGKHEVLMSQIAEKIQALQEAEDKKCWYAKEMENLTGTLKKAETNLNEKSKKFHEILGEKEMLVRKLEEKEGLLLELRRNYDSVMLEKNKLIELCQSDKSTEEILKQNNFQLQEELTKLRKENDAADEKYREIEKKLDESRVISEMLKKEMDEMCDKYDGFKEEIEFYKNKNDELNREIRSKEEKYSSYKNECDELRKSEKENLNLIEELKRDLECTKDKLEKSEQISNKLKEELSRNGTEERNSKLSLCLEDIPLENDDYYRQTVQKYLKDSKFIDLRRLMNDLIQLENSRVLIQKGDQGTLTEETSSEYESTIMVNRKLIKECEDLKAEVIEMNRRNKESEETSKRRENRMKEKLTLLRQAASEIRLLQMQLKEEVQNHFSCHKAVEVKMMQDICRNIREVFYNLQNGNSELLSEMNDMNQVLKERGEAISKLEQLNEKQRKQLCEAHDKISQLDTKLTEKKNSIRDMVSQLEGIKLEAEDKEKTIKELEEEIWKLKNSDSSGEVLSSSTLSKAEEATRLVDVEESFEERYIRIKAIAAKLKKKVTEQQKQLEEERNKSLAKANEFQTKVANFQSQIKTLMNLQSEYDKLQDNYEEEKNDKNALRKIIESGNEKIDSLKQEVENLKAEKEKFLNDKTSFENVKKKLSAQIIALKQTIEEEKSKQTKLEKEIEKSEYERNLREKKLEEEKEKHRATTAQLDKQKMETKNLGVLKLEIAEYERSVSDLEKKLAVRDEELKELNILLENQRSQCKLYLDEITHLKSQLTEENERATEASNQMRRFNEESSSREVELKEKLNEIGNLKVSLEEKKKEIEEKSLELAKIGQEKLKIEEKYKNIEDHCMREIQSLQDTVGNLQDSLNQRDLELTELRKEYDAYKVRAQSVLRQSQKEMNQSKQRNVIEELEQLRSTSDSLKARLEDSGLKMQKLVEENEVFQDEKNRLYSRIQELKNSVSELRSENEELKQSKQKELEQHDEALKLQKLQSETLAHCFQKKIDELEKNHKAQVDELIKENEQMQKQFQKVLLSANEKPNERRDYSESKRSASGFIPVKSEKEVLDVMLLEREECEGSESVDSISPQAGNNMNLIPLDQLLNSSDHAEPSEVKRSPMQDLHQLNEKIEKSENRIKHLTVLLSEAETDCARLQHLNDVLKEEIRRNQRNVEREQHAQNFEYMKNVVLKFISLHNTDERVRLVPVLNTILKLSPEEENILANAARGYVEQSSSNRGWGSYLNIWPSG